MEIILRNIFSMGTFIRRKFTKTISIDLVFWIYATTSLVLKGLISFVFLKNFHWILISIINFPIAIIITLSFIWISNKQKIDWHAKKKSGLISKIIKYYYKKNKIMELLWVLSGTDPFFYYEYLEKESTKRKLVKWTLLMLSLLFTSLTWMGFGILYRLIKGEL